jgi:hypothetical protein
VCTVSIVKCCSATEQMALHADLRGNAHLASDTASTPTALARRPARLPFDARAAVLVCACSGTQECVPCTALCALRWSAPVAMALRTRLNRRDGVVSEAQRDESVQVVRAHLHRAVCNRRSRQWRRAHHPIGVSGNGPKRDSGENRRRRPPQNA